MLITDENFPKPRFWLHNSIKNFDEANIGKRICFLVWSCDSRVISQQIDFAVAQSADLIVSEIYPHELPENTTIGQYEFLKSRFVFMAPEKGVQLTIDEGVSEDIVNIIYQEKSSSQNLLKTLKVIKENDFFNVIFIEEEEFVESYEFTLKSKSLVIFIHDLALKRAVIYESYRSDNQIFMAKNDIFQSLDYVYSQSSESPIIADENESIRSTITNIINITKKDKLNDLIQLNEHLHTEIYQREFSFEIPLRYTDSTKDSYKKKHLTRFIKNFYYHRILDCKSSNKESDFNSRLFLRDWFTDLTEAIQNRYWESELLKFFKVAGLEYSLQVIGEIESKQNGSLLNYDVLCFSLAKKYFSSKESEEKNSYIQLLKLISEKGIIRKTSVFHKHLMEFLNENQKQDRKITDSLEKTLDDKKNQSIKDKIFRIYSLALSLTDFLDLLKQENFKRHLSADGFIEIIKDKLAVKNIAEVYKLPEQNEEILNKISSTFLTFGIENLTDNTWQNAFFLISCNQSGKYNLFGLCTVNAFYAVIGILLNDKHCLSSLGDLNLMQDKILQNENWFKFQEMVQGFDAGQFSIENKPLYLLYKLLTSKDPVPSDLVGEIQFSVLPYKDFLSLKHC